MPKSVFIDAVKDMIPREVWQRKKTGFEMPFANWMNGGLNAQFRDILEQSQSRDLFASCILGRLKRRVKTRSLKSNDWMSLVLLSGLERYNISTNSFASL